MENWHWKKLIFAVILGVTLFSAVNAITINQFNNSQTTETLTFSGNQNITRYLNIPQYVNVTSAILTQEGGSIYACNPNAANLTLNGGTTLFTGSVTYNIITLTNGARLQFDTNVATISACAIYLSDSSINTIRTYDILYINTQKLYMDSYSNLQGQGGLLIGSNGGGAGGSCPQTYTSMQSFGGTGGYTGGGDAGYASNNRYSDGGGGAGYGGSGVHGYHASSHSQDAVGASYGASSDKNVYIGSGGGGGACGHSNGDEYATGGLGGQGGNAISVYADYLNSNGSIWVYGADADNGYVGGSDHIVTAGGGGGGSGGTILIQGKDIKSLYGSLDASGGKGGTGDYGTGYSTYVGGGGGGAGGRIKLFYGLLENPSFTINVVGGQGRCIRGSTTVGCGSNGSSGTWYSAYDPNSFSCSLFPYLNVGSSQIWTSLDMYFCRENTTSNFASSLNTAINSTGSFNCPQGIVKGDGTCDIPFTFHSDANGKTTYSTLQITYTLYTPPSISLNLPSNNSIFNTTKNVNFNFTATDDSNATFSCGVYLDNVLNQTNSSTVNNTLTNFLINGISKGNHSWYVNCTDGLLSNVSETRYFTIQHAINNISTTPSIVKMFNNFNISVNVTNLADTTANVSIKFPNGTMANYTTSSSGGLLITQNFTATNGTYYINATTDDGSMKSYNFTVTDNYLYLPSSYTSITQAGLNFSIITSIFEDTAENLSHTYTCAVNDGTPTNFSCVIPTNPLYVVSSGAMTLNITTNATTPDGTYSGNITIKRNIDNLTQVIPLSLSMSTDFGQPYIINKTDWTLSMYDNDTNSTSYLVNNTGTYNLTYCTPSITGDFVNQSWYSLSLNPTIEVGQVRNLIVTYAFPTARTNPYIGFLQINCKATVGGVVNTLAPYNQPYFAVQVVSGGILPPAPPSGGGGGGTQPTACGANVITNPTTITLSPQVQAVILTVTNNNNIQISPSYEIKVSGDGADASNLVQLIGTGGGILSSNSQKITVSLKPDMQITEYATAKIVITNAKCTPIEIPIVLTTSTSVSLPDFVSLFGNLNETINATLFTIGNVAITYGEAFLIGFAVIIGIIIATASTSRRRR